MIGPFWCPSIRNWLMFDKQNDITNAFVSNDGTWKAMPTADFWIVDCDGNVKGMYLYQGQVFQLTLSILDGKKILVTEQFNESTSSFSRLNQARKNKAFIHVDETSKQESSLLDQMEKILAAAQLEKTEDEYKPPFPRALKDFTQQDLDEVKVEPAQVENTWEAWKKLKIRDSLALQIPRHKHTKTFAETTYYYFQLVLEEQFNFTKYPTMQQYREALEDCLTNLTNPTYLALEQKAAETQIDIQLNLNPDKIFKVRTFLKEKKVRFIFAVLMAEREHLLNHFGLEVPDLINILDKIDNANLQRDLQPNQSQNIYDPDLQSAIQQSLVENQYPVSPSNFTPTSQLNPSLGRGNSDLDRAIQLSLEEQILTEVKKASLNESKGQESKETPLITQTPNLAPNNYHFQLKCYAAKGLISALVLIAGILLASLSGGTIPLIVGGSVAACIGLFGVVHSLAKSRALINNEGVAPCTTPQPR